MIESIQKCKVQLQLLKRIRLFNLDGMYAHFTCLNDIQTWWAELKFHTILTLNGFLFCFILHHNMEGVHFENFYFYFLHWFMQCPNTYVHT